MSGGTADDRQARRRRLVPRGAVRACSASPSRSRCVRHRARSSARRPVSTTATAILQVALLIASRSSSSSGSAASTTGSTGRAGADARRGPLRPRRDSWKDYFRVNTDHKVIGDPVRRALVLLPLRRRPDGDAHARRARAAGPPVRGLRTRSTACSRVHASLLIFLFIIPVFAGLANYVLPLMIGAPDMAFPRLNALSFWMLPVAGVMMLLSFFAPGRLVRHRLDGLRAAVDRQRRSARCSSRSAVQFAGASSIATALNFLVTIITMRAPGHDVLPDAAARLGELLDLAAGRHRDAVHRRLAVLRPARPRARLQLLRPRRRAATC